MKPITTLLADDEPLARRGLRVLLGEDPDLEVVAEARDGDETHQQIARHAPELVFLDIAMPGPDGLEVAQTLGPQGPLVVFVTAFDRFAIDAFETEAVDYLLKPFDDQRFDKTLDRVKRRVRERRIEQHRREIVALLGEPDGGAPNAEAPPSPKAEQQATNLQRLVLRSTGRIRVITIDEVDWIAGAGNYVRLHRGTHTDLHRTSLADLERQLDPARFVRVHRSAIVNVGQVRDLRPLDRGDYRLTLRDGTELKMSRSFRHQLPRLLGDG